MSINARDVHCAILGILFAIAALVVVAQPCAAEAAGNKAAAEALFEQGKLLMQSGDYRQACLKFEASGKLDEGIGTLLYLADCYEKTGRTASAWATFKEAASIAGAQNEETRQKLALKRAGALEPTLVKLTVEVAAGNASILGFEVRNDGTTVPSAQYAEAVPVDPGEHRVEASAPGKRTFSQQVTVTRGIARVSIPVLTDLSSSASTPVAPAPSASGVSPRLTEPASASTAVLAPGASQPSTHDVSPSSVKTQRIVSIIAAGLGVAGVGVGTYFGLAAMHDNSRSKGDCPIDPNVCGNTGYQQRQDALREARISTVGFVAGGVLLATGAVLYFTTQPGGAAPELTARAELSGPSALITVQSNW